MVAAFFVCGGAMKGNAGCHIFSEKGRQNYDLIFNKTILVKNEQQFLEDYWSRYNTHNKEDLAAYAAREPEARLKNGR